MTTEAERLKALRTEAQQQGRRRAHRGPDLHRMIADAVERARLAETPEDFTNGLAEAQPGEWLTSDMASVVAAYLASVVYTKEHTTEVVGRF